MPERPDSSLKEGILPALLRQLVERRKQVKGFMKDKNATQEQLFAVSPFSQMKKMKKPTLRTQSIKNGSGTFASRPSS